MNSLRAWLIAFRLRTLPAGMSPVFLSYTFAKYQGFEVSLGLFISCLVCTLLLQISSNLINDYYDHLSGVDSERDKIFEHSYKRVSSSGMIPSKNVKTAFCISLFISFLIGLYLMSVGGLPIIIIGVLSLLGAFMYTGGPIALSHYRLGEFLALIFFGILAVGGSYYLFTFSYSRSVLVLSLVPGFLSAMIMNINNLRDYKTDLQHDKKTLSNFFNYKTAHFIPLFIGFLAFIAHLLLSLQHSSFWYFTPLFIILTPVLKSIHDSFKNKSEEFKNIVLNSCLGKTGKFLFIYSVCIYIGLILI